MNLLLMLWQSLASTLRDVAPLLAIIAFFQLVILRRPLTNLPRLLWGVAFVLVGLSLFLLGLELALFPLGEEMAAQLFELQAKETASAETASQGSREKADATFDWHGVMAYRWTYLFAFAIGISTTIAEPALIAVALKAEEVSGGTIRAWGLRLAVALGVGIGVAVGTLRIILGWPLPYLILVGYLVVTIQTLFAPKQIVPLAYDSGGVTTSTVTVPLVAALGLGLASRVPGRDAVIDGFGLIAFASLFPMITVMGYAQIAQWRERRSRGEDHESSTPQSSKPQSSEPQPSEPQPSESSDKTD